MNKVVFLHVPKVGGTSVRAAVSRLYDDADVCPERYDQLHRWDAEKLNSYKFFAGHFSFGSLHAIQGPVKLLAMFREPKELLLSAYYFARSHRWSHIERSAPDLAVAKRLSLKEYLLEEGHRLKPYVHIFGAGDLNRALDAVRTCDGVGLIEEADKSLLNLTRRAGLPPVFTMPVENVTGARTDDPAFEPEVEPRQPITEEIRDILDTVTADEQIVYRTAVHMFREQTESGG